GYAAKRLTRPTGVHPKVQACDPPLSIRLSAIVAERGEPHGCGERHCRARDGPSMPAPRSDDGAKGPGAARRDGLRGKRFWLFLPGPAIRRLAKVTRPGGRNLQPAGNREISPAPELQAKRNAHKKDLARLSEPHPFPPMPL